MLRDSKTKKTPPLNCTPNVRQNIWGVFCFLFGCGVGQVHQLIAQLPQYERVYLYIDNDDAGRKVVEQVMQIHSNVVNESMQLFPDFKDFNEFLCKKR